MTPTIDTLINTFVLFATVILGAFVAIGGLIVWNGIELRNRAEKDLDKIEEAKARTEQKEQSVQAIYNQAKSILTALTEQAQGLQKVAADLQKRLEQADIKDKKSSTLLSNLEQRASTLTNTLQGTANLFKSPSVEAANHQDLAYMQPSYPQNGHPFNHARYASPINPAVYGNPITQPLSIKSPSLTTTEIKGVDSLTVELGTKKN